MLVSGTAVDLARIHTARSIVQDANQLAANSVLTQYNALLYDIYGLMGVAEDDPILAELLDAYIRVSVFGEETQSKDMGTLQLFYGANISTEAPLFPEKQNLGDNEVLRRQIEEYMKFRGPVLIVKEFIEALEGNKLKQDADIVKDKLEIDSTIADIYEKYKELYNSIIAADKCDQVNGGIAGGTVGTVSSRLTALRTQFVNLEACYVSWENVDDADGSGQSRKKDYAAKYAAIRNNIKISIIGGRIGENWSNGDWRSYGNTQGLNTTIENAKTYADTFKPKFDTVVTISREIDGMRKDLSAKIDELERKLNERDCSDDIRNALTKKTGTPPKSLIERYRSILTKDDLASMATVSKDSGYSYIDNELKPIFDDVRYRNSKNPSAGNLTLDQLTNLPSNSGFALSESVPAENSRAAVFAGFPADSVTLKMPPGFKRFSDQSDAHRVFFDELTMMMNQTEAPPVKLYDKQPDEKGSNSAAKQKNIIDAVFELVQSAYIGMTNNPLGAEYITDSETPDPEKPSAFNILEMLPEALSQPVINIISDPLGSLAKMGDYILLLTYDTAVFSNYTTTRPDSVGKKRGDTEGIDFPKSMTGVPISPKVNYFFQSEWEYLYNGSSDAGENLSAVSRLLFLVRLICDYIVVFNVTEVTTIVTSIQTAFSWAPPLGIVLGELARGAFAAAEALIDVAALRSGHKVPLMKNVSSGEWVCSPSGLVAALQSVAAKSGDTKKDEKGITYSQYMLFFFLTKGIVYIGKHADAATELAIHTGNLIEWNINNYKNDVGADEEKMKGILGGDDRFRLSEMKTGFSLTTSVDMRMLFLSMVFAQKFSDSNGIGMPETMNISVTDYRCY